MAVNPQPPDLGLISHWKELLSIISPLIMTIWGLLTWAKKSHDKTIDGIITVMEKHAAEDDKVHDKIFTDLRETDSKLNTLIGGCKARQESKDKKCG